MLNIFKLFSDNNRLRIFSLLINGELCVCEIEVILELSQSNLSKHLGVLKKQGIIKSRKQSLWTMYSLEDSFIEDNKFLYNYIKENIQDNIELKNDLERLETYYKKNISCQLASENRDEVLRILNEGRG